MFLGDSNTSGQANDGLAFDAKPGISYPTWACYRSGGRLIRVKNAGVPGDTTREMLARFDAAMTPYSPSVVVIMASTNDTKDEPVGTSMAEYQATSGRWWPKSARSARSRPC